MQFHRILIDQSLSHSFKQQSTSMRYVRMYYNAVCMYVWSTYVCSFDLCTVEQGDRKMYVIVSLSMYVCI